MDLGRRTHDAGTQHVDIVTSGPRDRDMHIDIVDVLTADHPAPRVEETLLGRRMVKIQGGTQALRRTINARLEISPGTVTTLSVPGPLGALILKAAAYSSDTRDRDRHLFDAAVLLACIADPLVERDCFAGSDRRRVGTLTRALPTDHPAWRQLPATSPTMPRPLYAFSPRIRSDTQPLQHQAKSGLGR